MQKINNAVPNGIGIVKREKRSFHNTLPVFNIVFNIIADASYKIELTLT